MYSRKEYVFVICKEEEKVYNTVRRRSGGIQYHRDQTIYIFASSVDLQANSLKCICRLTAMNM